MMIENVQVESYNNKTENFSKRIFYVKELIYYINS